MNKMNFIIPVIIGIFSFSCGKDDDDAGSGDTPSSFELSFYFVDSLGNNLLPYDLSENPVVNPESFSAHSDNIDDIGHYSRSEEYGYLFHIREQFYSIRNDSIWLQDSIFYLYSCFDQECDTIKIYKPDLINGSNDEPTLCSAEWILYQSDSLDLPYCRIIPVNFN